MVLLLCACVRAAGSLWQLLKLRCFRAMHDDLEWCHRCLTQWSVAQLEPVWACVWPQMWRGLDVTIHASCYGVVRATLSLRLHQ